MVNQNVGSIHEDGDFVLCNIPASKIVQTCHRDLINRKIHCITTFRTVQAHGRHLINVLNKCVYENRKRASERRVCIMPISEESLNELPKSSRELKTIVFLREKGHLLKQASTPSQGQHYHSPQGARDGQPTCLLGDSRKVQREDWMSPM